MDKSSGGLGTFYRVHTGRSLLDLKESQSKMLSCKLRGWDPDKWQDLLQFEPPMFYPEDVAKAIFYLSRFSVGMGGFRSPIYAHASRVLGNWKDVSRFSCSLSEPPFV